jgi:hypothetical protein
MMQPNTFDVIPRCKKISLFKLGKLWVFEHFFDNMGDIFVSTSLPFG